MNHVTIGGQSQVLRVSPALARRRRFDPALQVDGVVGLG